MSSTDRRLSVGRNPASSSRADPTPLDDRTAERMAECALRVVSDLASYTSLNFPAI